MPLKRIMLLPSSEQPMVINDTTTELTLDALSTELHEDAKKILGYLSNSDVKVTTEGRVYYDWLEQSGSYLWFLIRYFLSKSKTYEETTKELKQPIDFEYFKQLMKQANIPDDLFAATKESNVSSDQSESMLSDSVQWLSMY